MIHGKGLGELALFSRCVVQDLVKHVKSNATHLSKAVKDEL